MVCDKGFDWSYPGDTEMWHVKSPSMPPHEAGGGYWGILAIIDRCMTKSCIYLHVFTKVGFVTNRANLDSQSKRSKTISWRITIICQNEQN